MSNSKKTLNLRKSGFHLKINVWRTIQVLIFKCSKLASKLSTDIMVI